MPCCIVSIASRVTIAVSKRKKFTIAFVCISCITEKHRLGTLYRAHSLRMRNKRFHLVSEQRKTEVRDFWLWRSEKWNESQNMRHFSHGLWLLFLVLCSETARKRLLRRLSCIVLCGFFRSSTAIGYGRTSLISLPLTRERCVSVYMKPE